MTTNSSSVNNTDQPTNHGLRNRRISIVDYIEMTKNRQQDVRAQQRTFEGAYIRTALGQMTFSLVILKMFSREFIPIGTVFIIYSLLMILIALVRGSGISYKFIRRNEQNESNDRIYFDTSGATVLITGILSLGSFIVMLVLALMI